jgi:hypothetical protein
MSNEEIPSVWSKGYVHEAELPCWSCLGEGTVDGYECGVCLRKGKYRVGCGGLAEMDEQHPALGGNCFRCGIVGVEELRTA